MYYVLLAIATCCWVKIGICSLSNWCVANWEGLALWEDYTKQKVLIQREMYYGILKSVYCWNIEIWHKLASHGINRPVLELFGSFFYGPYWEFLNLWF